VASALFPFISSLNPYKKGLLTREAPLYNPKRVSILEIGV